MTYFLEFIAEPGRHFVCESHVLVTNVMLQEQTVLTPLKMLMSRSIT